MGAFDVEIPIRAVNLTKKAFGAVGKEIDTLRGKARQLSAAGRNISAFGRNITSASARIGIFGAATTGALAVVGTQFATFETGLARVSTLLDIDAAGALERFGGAITDLSVKTGKSTADLNAALFQTISAGVDSADAIKFLDVATRAAVGGFTSVETVVDGLTNVINAYGLANEDVARISDQFFIANELGKTTIDELSVSIGNVGAIAASAGVGTAELLGSITAITKGGINTSTAINGLRQVISNIVKPSKQAVTAMEDINRALPEAKKIAFSGEALKKLGLEKFVANLKRIEAASPKKFALLFESVEARSALQTLFTQTDTFSTAVMRMNAATNEGAITQANFAKVSATLAFKFSVAKQRVAAIARSLGVALAPALTKGLELFGKLTTIVSRFINENKKLVTIAISVVAVIGVIAVTLGGLGLVIGPIISGFGLMVTAIGAVIGFMSGTVIVVSSAIAVFGTFFAGVITGFGKALFGVDNFKDTMTATGKVLKVTVVPAFKFLLDKVLIPIIGAFKNIFKALFKFGNAVGKFLGTKLRTTLLKFGIDTTDLVPRLTPAAAAAQAAIEKARAAAALKEKASAVKVQADIEKAKAKSVSDGLDTQLGLLKGFKDRLKGAAEEGPLDILNPPTFRKITEEILSGLGGPGFGSRALGGMGGTTNDNRQTIQIDKLELTNIIDTPTFLEEIFRESDKLAMEGASA